MKEITWTAAQSAAIRTTGTSILVSAGAGSGKTAVLAERCAYLVADVRPACGVDRLLVVTFTDAAAAEMRERIGEALRTRLRTSPTHRGLQQQLALLDTASISTIHSFCKQVLNRYFAQADVDPQSPVMDANDASLLRQETASRVFDQFADRRGPSGEAFLDFLAAYGGRSERGLIERALGVDAFLNSIPDPDRWMAEAVQRSACPAPGRLPDVWTRLLRDTLATELARQLEAVRGELSAPTGRMPVPQESTGKMPVPQKSTGRMPVPQQGVVGDFAACLDEYGQALETWRGQVARLVEDPAMGDRCLVDIGDYAFPRLPRLTQAIKKRGDAAVSEFETTKERVKRVRDVMFTKRLKEAFGGFTTADWAEGIARTRKHVEVFLSLVGAIRKAYQEAKRELGVVDFADLERMTLDLLHDETNGVAARLRDRYEHVLVDEFQDVNAVQAEILRSISRECDSERTGNLFAVGDVKQSIYRFRLAEPRLFLQRKDAFAPHVADGDRRQGDAASVLQAGRAEVRGVSDASGVAIDLATNFRSLERILDAINDVFKRLMAPDLGGIAYDDRAHLTPGRDDADGAGVIDAAGLELHVLDDLSGPAGTGNAESGSADAFDWERIEREAYVIAERIKALVAIGTPHADIVILLRSMQPRAGLLLRTIRQLGVPVFADSSGGFFESLEILDLLSLLALLDNEQQDVPWAAVLRSPLFGRRCTDDELVEIRTTARRRGPGVPFHAAIRDYARQGPNEALRTRLSRIRNRIGRWRRRVRRRPLADVLWEIYEESGYLAYLRGLPGGEQRRANLLRLHEYARQFATFRRQGLYRFLQFVNGLQEAGEDLDAGSVVSPSQDVVRVMTIHRSKGLQFPVVILGELGKRFNLSDARGSILFDRRLGVAMDAVDVERHITYPTLPHRIVSLAAVSESLAEELRVLYVALTRAEDRLILVGTGRPSALARDRQRYAGHAGALPVLDRQTAQSMLDWVSAAIGCQPPESVSFGDGTCGTDVPPAGASDARPASQRCKRFEVHTYDRDRMAQWVIEPPRPTGVSDRLRRYAGMAPLEARSGRKTDEAVLRTVARRLTTAYPAAALTRVPAVAAASVLKRRWEVRQDHEAPAAAWSGGPGRQAGPDRPGAPGGVPGAIAGRPRFRRPAFLDSARAPDQTDRGTWTHEFLQRLDLRRACDAVDLRAQLAAMVASGTMSTSEAAGIDLDAVAWFFQTPLAARLCSDGVRVLREWPFVLGVDPSRYDPSAAARDRDDLMLVRGIIDCLFEDGNGWEILDYKTDAVAGPSLAARAETYRGQLGIYAAAMEAVWRRGVRRRWLVFLSARQIVEV